MNSMDGYSIYAMTDSHCHLIYGLHAMAPTPDEYDSGCMLPNSAFYEAVLELVLHSVNASTMAIALIYISVRMTTFTGHIATHAHGI